MTFTPPASSVLPDCTAFVGPNFAHPPVEEKNWPVQLHSRILAILAAMFGALSGLLLIYTVDLPQIQDLERYRPNTTTLLYDVHGKQIGSFALERRIVVGYDDISPLLRNAVISIEDKNFESHWGVNVFRVAGAAYRDLTTIGVRRALRR